MRTPLQIPLGTTAVALLLLSILPARPAAAQPRLVVDQPIVALPESYQGELLETRFLLKNQGDEPLEITRVESGPHAVEHPDRIAAGDSADLEVSLDPLWSLGLQTARIRVHSNDPGAPVTILAARGFVQSSFLPESPVLSLGSVLRATGAEADLLVECVDQVAPTFEFEGDLPDGVALTVTPETATRGAARIQVRLEAGMEPGILDRFLVFRTNSPNHRLYRIRLTAQIVGEVGAHPSRIDFGPVPLGETATATLELHSAIPDLGWSEPSLVQGVQILSQEACSSAPSCRRYELQATGGSLGLWKEKIRFEFDSQPAVEVPLSAFVMNPGTRVTHLGDLDALARPPAPDPRRTAVDEPADPPADRRTDDSPWPRLRWLVTQEDRVYGYTVMRSTARTGPFVRVNDEIIPRRYDEAGTAAGVAYSWEDRTAESGRTYYYFVDAVSMTGTKQALSGVLSRTTSE